MVRGLARSGARAVDADRGEQLLVPPRPSAAGKATPGDLKKWGIIGGPDIADLSESLDAIRKFQGDRHNRCSEHEGITR